MALLNNPAAMPNQAPADSTTKNENIYTAQQTLSAPKKVSSRPVEPVPVKFDEEEANKMASFAKSNAASGSVSGRSLVQNQLNNVLAADGPLLKRARADGMNSAAERGLNNASMGVQAGEEAVVRQALAIATPDAQTHGEMDRANHASASAMAQMGVNQAYTDYNQRKQNAFVTAENNADRNQKDDLFERGNTFADEQQTKQNQFVSGESLLDRKWRADEQNKQNLFSSGEANLDRTWKSNEQERQNIFADAQQNKQNLFTSGEANLDRTWKSNEQDKQNNFVSGESLLDRKWKTDEQAKQNDFADQQQYKQNNFASLQMGREQEFRLEEIKANANEQIRVSASQVDDKFKAQYLDSATNLQKGLLEMQTAILNNSQGKSDAQVTNALNVAKKQFESSVSWLQGVYKQGGTQIDAGAFPGLNPAANSPATPAENSTGNPNYAQITREHSSDSSTPSQQGQGGRYAVMRGR